MKVSKEFKIGVLTIVTAAMLYFGFNFLKGTDFFSSTSHYYALYETVDGLKVSNPVIINGYSVGRVSRIKILQDRNNLVLVEMRIDEDILLGKSTTAKLYSTDFLGSKAIELSIGSIETPLEDGDTLVSEVDKGLTEFIKKSALPVADTLAITISRINAAIGQIEVMATQVNGIISDNRAKTGEIMSGLQRITRQLSVTISKVDPVLENANGALEKVNTLDLQQTLTETQQVLAHVNQTLDMFNKSEGTVGRLLKEDSIYSNLNRTISDLDSLIVHINTYPKHFFAPLGKSRKKIEREMEKNRK